MFHATFLHQDETFFTAQNGSQKGLEKTCPDLKSNTVVFKVKRRRVFLKRPDGKNGAIRNKKKAELHRCSPAPLNTYKTKTDCI